MTIGSALIPHGHGGPTRPGQTGPVLRTERVLDRRTRGQLSVKLVLEALVVGETVADEDVGVNVPPVRVGVTV
jgi:hypothetical protein